MSAAADTHTLRGPVSVRLRDQLRAFLARPPLLGWLSRPASARWALLAVAVLIVPAALTVSAARPPSGAAEPR